jgi:hypothetical protein
VGGEIYHIGDHVTYDGKEVIITNINKNGRPGILTPQQYQDKTGTVFFVGPDNLKKLHRPELGKLDGPEKSSTEQLRGIISQINSDYPQITISPDGTIPAGFLGRNRRRVEKLRRTDGGFDELMRAIERTQDSDEFVQAENAEFDAREEKKQDEAIKRAGFDKTDTAPQSAPRRAALATGNILEKGLDTISPVHGSGRDITKGRGSKWKKEAFNISTLTDEQLAEAHEADSLRDLRKEVTTDVAAQKMGYASERLQSGELQKRGIFTRFGERLSRVFDFMTPGTGTTPKIKRPTISGRDWYEKTASLENMSPENLAQYDQGIELDEMTAQARLENKGERDLTEVADEHDEHETNNLSILDYIDQLATYGIKTKPDGSVGLFSKGKHKKLYASNENYAKLFDEFAQAVIDGWKKV